MSRRTIVISGLVAALLAGGIVFALLSTDGDESVTGPAALPEIEEGQEPPPSTETTLTEPADAPEPRVGETVTADDPVPDDVVAALFDKLQLMDVVPLMNETYTVEFDGSTDRVRIEGTFEDGDAEYVFVFVGSSWALEGEL